MRRRHRIQTRSPVARSALLASLVIAGAAQAAVVAQDRTAVATAATKAAAAAAGPSRLAGTPVASIDQLPSLPACASPLRATAPSPRPGVGRLSVRVECDGPPSWRVWVPVTLPVKVAMVVLKRDLARDALITAADLERVERVSERPGRWVSDPDQLVGRRLREPLPAGSALQLSATRADRLVMRGQQVTIATRVGPLQVTARGIAVADGGLGARIRVRSLSSNRVLEGVVRSSELVEVLSPGSGSG